MTSTESSSQEETVMDMRTCPNCQRSVPTSNYEVHNSRCNRGRLNLPQQEEESTNIPEEEHNDAEPQQQEEQSSDPDDSASSIPRNNSFLTRFDGDSDWQIVNPAVMASHRSNRQTSQPGNTGQLREGQWRCTRCTLINEGHHVVCDACMLPRNTNLTGASIARRNAALTTSISNDTLNGSNITYRSTMSNLSTANRVLNGAINGAMIGSVFGGVGGLIVGGITGAASGMFIDRIRSRGGEQLEASEREMLLNDNGGLQPGTMRVHRGENFITAASTNRHGSTRVIRLRYGTGNLPGRAATENQEQVERTMLELLLRTSYNRPMMHGSHIIIQPEATFEDLLERFGTGLEGRGASQEVIDSYPVEIVGSDGKDGSTWEERTSSDKSDDDSESAKKRPKIDVGTCNICLEDYQGGDEKKSLSCPHAFHKGCIDEWLKRVASCPVCKADVGMYKKPPAKEHSGEAS
mmetsp:Transcript_23100/g.38060  ORF Transcript_23100/g.38060 Transcript_23100/m.38060 type:complete len:464 (+) Transcript_23100:152-1543(+)